MPVPVSAPPPPRPVPPDAQDPVFHHYARALAILIQREFSPAERRVAQRLLAIMKRPAEEILHEAGLGPGNYRAS